MVLALIKNNIIENTIIVEDESISFNFHNRYAVLRIDNLNPQPGIGWTWDGTSFLQPQIIPENILTEDQITYDLGNVEDTSQEKINKEAELFLLETDWKVIRHIDEKALGLSTSISEEEYQALLIARQEARQRILK